MKLTHSSSKRTWSCYNVFARDPYSRPGACTRRFVSQICDTKDFQVTPIQERPHRVCFTNQDFQVKKCLPWTIITLRVYKILG